MYPSQVEITQPDGEWLVIKGEQRAKLVFVVDSPATKAMHRCAKIDRWVREDKPLIDIEVVSPAEFCVRKYHTDRITRETLVEEISEILDMETVLTKVSEDLFCCGGKIVFIHESNVPLASTTLLALWRAAGRVPLDYVSLARVSEAS